MHRKLDWLFLLLSAGVVWMSNPPRLFSSALTALNLRSDGYVGGFLEGVTIGLFLVVAQGIALWVFERFLMPLSTNYKGGTWVYSLLPEPNEEFSEPRPSVGRFRIKFESGRYVVEDGYAYWVVGNQLQGRARWSSSIVSISRNRIDIIYQLSGEFTFDERTKHYEGHIRLEKVYEAKVIGKPHRGHFNDLEERAHFKGPIYAERVSRFQSGAEDLRRQLLLKNEELIDKLKSDS